MSEDTAYKPGDVVNGHYLGTDNVWHPVENGAPAAGDDYSPAAPAVPAPTPAPLAEKRKPHVLSIIALVVAAVGFIFACVPGALIVGWILLPVGFVLSIVGFFLNGSKWATITALVLSVVGTIVGFVVFFAVVSTSISSALDTTDGKPAPAATDAAESDSDAADTKVVNPNFGDTFAYKDGVTISVSAPTPFTPGEYAYGADQASNVALTFTIVNGSTKNLDVLAFPTVTSAGVAASDVFDSDNAALSPAPPTSTVLPGQSLTWTAAYSIADPNSLQVEVTPSTFAYDEAIFTNVAG